MTLDNFKGETISMSFCIFQCKMVNLFNIWGIFIALFVLLSWLFAVVLKKIYREMGDNIKIYNTEIFKCTGFLLFLFFT